MKKQIVGILFSLLLVSGCFSENNKDEAFKVDGEVVKMDTLQGALKRSKVQYEKSYGIQLPDSIINPIAIKELINAELLNELAEKSVKKDFKTEITTKIEEIKSNLGGEAKFNEFLKAQNYTLDELKEVLNQELIVQEYYRTILNSITVTPQEITKIYTENIDYFKGKKYDEIKSVIEDSLKKAKLNEIIAKNLKEAEQNMKVTSINKEIKSYFPTDVAFSYDGVKVSNLEYSREILNNLGKVKNVDEAEKIAKTNIERAIKTVALLEKEGVKVDKTLPLNQQFVLAVDRAYNVFKEKIDITDGKLKEYFEKVKGSYNRAHSANADLAVLNIQPTEADINITKRRARAILKKSTPSNFENMAKRYSDSPSGKDGGVIPPFKKGEMVESFDKAAFSGEVGKVYPKVIETVYGEHILYIKDRKNGVVTGNQILVQYKPSKSTINKALKELKVALRDLRTNKIEFNNLTKVDKSIKIIGKVDNIQKGYNLPGKLINDILSANVGNVGYFADENNRYYIYKKLKDNPAQEAIYENIKDRLSEDYKNSIIRKKYIEIQNEVAKSIGEKK